MDDKTKTMMLTMAATVAKNGLMALGSTAATHGIINGNQTETFVAIGMAVLGGAWSFWNSYGRAIVVSQLEVLKAKSLAQAAKMSAAGVPPVTVTQIADESPTLQPAEVAKTMATLPPTIQANVAKVVVVAALLVLLAFPQPASAQVKLVKPTGNIVNDIAAAAGGKPAATSAPSTAASSPVDSAVSSFSAGVQKIEKELVDKGIADLNAAITDATNHKDAISLPCWQANLALLQSLPSQWETPPSPIGIALGIQIQRDLLNAITGNDPTSLKVACAALWGDQLKIVTNLGALIGVRIATGGLF